MSERQGFAAKLITWQAAHGRNNLPWQRRGAYETWLSEIMLQQTQVATVIGYYARFLDRFPDVQTLAAASEDEVLALWSGLGYYSRARNLHAAARTVLHEFGGIFPRDPQALQSLKGVGRSTAAAIAAFSYGVRAAILDGNVKRVLCRHFNLADPPSAKRDAALWTLAESLLPRSGIESYSQGLMDLGSLVCTPKKPACELCPMRETCAALALGRVSELPAKAATKKRERRVKNCVMLVLTYENKHYLEPRPESGIWAKLHSFPQFETPNQALLWLQNLQLSAQEPIRTGVLKHSFTHYDLMIEPWFVGLNRPMRGVREGGGSWHSQAQLLGLGVPRVVGKLLRIEQQLMAEPD